MDPLNNGEELTNRLRDYRISVESVESLTPGRIKTITRLGLLDDIDQDFLYMYGDDEGFICIAGVSEGIYQIRNRTNNKLLAQNDFVQDMYKKGDIHSYQSQLELRQKLTFFPENF
ncbi:MAG: hypothetical protein ACP5N2_04695 [Candidatus Nanoarchaeia archaeon]